MTIERVGSDGTVHSFPDGTSEDVIQRVTGTSHVVPQAPSSSKLPPAEAGPIRAFAQGASMGFSDEAMAKMRQKYDQLTGNAPKPKLSDLIAGGPIPGSYEDYLQSERQGLHKYYQENPITANLAELGGGLATGLGATALTGGFAAPEAGAATAANAARLMPRIISALKPAAVGGAYGAVSGVGTSEKAPTLSNMAGEAGTGALTGALFGTAANQLVKRAPQVFEYGRSIFDKSNPDRQANLAIAKAMAKDGYSPASVQPTIDAMGRGEVTLADLGENTRALLKKATMAPGETRNTAIAALADRASEKVPRVSEDLRGLMSGSKDFYTDLQNMINARKEKAQPLYEAAFNNANEITPKTTEHLAKLRELPSFQEAMNAGMKRMADQGLDISSNKLRALHETKLALDDMIETKMRAGETNQAKTLIGMKNDLLKDMEKASPDYKLARAQFAGDSEMIDAMNKGKDVYKLTEPELRKLVSDYSDNPSKFDAMRAGAAQAMLEKLRASPDARPIKSVLGGDNERKLRTLFQDDNTFDQFKNRLHSEERMQLTQKQGIKATPTDVEAQQASSLGNAVTDAASGNFGSALSNVVNTVAPRVTGMPPQTAQATAQKLLTPANAGQTPLGGSTMDSNLQGIMNSLKQEEAMTNRFSQAGNVANAVGGNLGAQNPPSISGGFPRAGQPQQQPEGPAPSAQEFLENAPHMGNMGGPQSAVGGGLSAPGNPPMQPTSAQVAPPSALQMASSQQSQEQQPQPQPPRVGISQELPLGVSGVSPQSPTITASSPNVAQVSNAVPQIQAPVSSTTQSALQQAASNPELLALLASQAEA